MTVDYYFAYGSNMNSARVENRNMKFVSAQSGQLVDYQLAFNKRSTKYPGVAAANVIARPGSMTEGVLYQLTNPNQIEMMDPYEGYPIRYDRLELPIIVDGGVCDGWVYTANSDHVQEGLRPAGWYLDHLLAGRQYLSNDYYQKLTQVECRPDSQIEPA